MIMILNKRFQIFNINAFLQLPPKLNISSDSSYNPMAIISEKIQELRSKSTEPSRRVEYMVCTMSEAKASLKGIRQNKDYKDSEFLIEPLYIELVNEAVEQNGCIYSACFEHVLRYKYETINNCCDIIFKKFQEKNDAAGFTVQAYCTYPTCNKLRFDASYIDEDRRTMKVEVWSTNSSNQTVTHMKNKDGTVMQKRCQLRGVGRSLAKGKLTTSKAYPVRAEMVSKLGSLGLREQTGKDVIPSPAALRTAKSEKKNALNHDTDQMMDLIIMKRTNENFVKFISIPFTIELTYIPACRFYKGIKKHDTVYFDATGSTCKHPHTDLNKKLLKAGEVPLPQKKVLYYTTIAEKNEALLPLNMFVTEDHSSHNIGFHLKNFRLECVENKIWPLFRKVIIDFSTALAIAINVGYNDFPANTTMLTYLKFCYNIIKNNIKLPPKFIVVQGCCSHFAKMLSKDLDKHSPGINKKVKHLIQECMAFATTTETMEVQIEWWKLFCIIFGSRKHTTHVNYAITKMFFLIKYDENSPEKGAMENERKEIAAYSYEKVIYSNSPFFKDFSEAYEEELPKINQSSASDNEYFIEGLIDHYLNKYMFMICFWSNSMGRLISSGGEYFTTFFFIFFFKL